ncbi:hypothetical protein EV383_4412 [Pseudonocardia sediminis]|uniref:Uncharacterized protein n=1 Tax=Pseudonocardia sediminis TaxID=1397368 RepID=A0A4Q7UZB0_PSEST|nr:hypothetical protein [Pseudonocardia sediminis]RZT87487.1 hypothetical protein EV383_4412 [Pseudonocardia sediminis]
MTQLRILVTGSREWRDYATIRSDLLALLQLSTTGTPVLIQGGQVSRDKGTGERFGADYLAKKAWQDISDESGFQSLHEEVRADWTGPCDLTCTRNHRRPSRGGGTYCPAAGPRRNARMVTEHKPTHALAYPLGDSAGTNDCLRHLRAAGVPVKVWEPSSRPTLRLVHGGAL